VRIEFPVPQGRGITPPTALEYNSGELSTIVLDGVSNTTHWSASGAPTDGIPQANGWGSAKHGVLNVGGTMWSYSSPSPCPPNYPNCGATAQMCNVVNGFSFTDLQGTSHTLPIGAATLPNSPPANTTCSGSFLVSQGTDTQVTGALASNTLGQLAGNQQIAVSILDKDGNSAFASILLGQANPSETNIEDRNGNFVSNTDTAGRAWIAGDPATSTHQITVYGLSYTINTTTTTVNYPITVTAPPPVSGQDNIVCPNNAQLANNTATVTVASSLVLPNGQQYQFLYDGVYGLLKEIIYPNGGWVKYTWQLSPENATISSLPGMDYTTNVRTTCTYTYQKPVIQTRQVSYDGSSIAETQTFTIHTNWDPNTGDWTTKTTKVATQDSALGTANTLYTYVPASGVTFPLATACMDCIVPVESMVQRYDWNSSSLLETDIKAWYNSFQLACDFRTLNNMSPALRQIVDEAQQRYNTAVQDWAASTERNSASVSTENPQ
jgi:hypothetical protein